MSLNNRAVITVQVGHYANFVGTHFWNFQDANFNVNRETNDVDHDVLHREGQTLDRQTTYMPRLVTVDLKGALGSLPEFGDLYHNDRMSSSIPKTDLSSQAAENWHSNKLAVQRAEPYRKTRYLQQLEDAEKIKLEEGKEIDDTGDPTSINMKGDHNLDEEVHLWSDFLRARFHPKTNVVIKEHGHANSIDPFDVHGLGIGLWNNCQTGFADEMEDRIRFFAEEADFLKGFQLLTDMTDAFGGVSSMLSQHIRDEFSSQAILAFPTLPTTGGENDILKTTGKALNFALASNDLMRHCDLLTPMSLALDTFPLRAETRPIWGLNYRSDSSYHTSSVLAMSLDSLTLPWRSLRGPYAPPGEVAKGLNSFGRKFACLQLGAPFSKQHLNDDLTKKISCLSPHISKVDLSNVWCQSASFRGAPPSGVSSLELLAYFDRVMPKTATAVTTSKCPLQVGAPFPSHIIDSANWDKVDKTVPVLTLWQSSQESGQIVQALAERSSKINLNKLHRFQEAGLDQDSLKESIEDLRKQADCYL